MRRPQTKAIFPVDRSGEHVLAIFDTTPSAVSPRLYESTDAASTWTPIMSKIAPDAFVYDLEQSTSGTVFAGSNHGVFKSQ